MVIDVDVPSLPSTGPPSLVDIETNKKGQDESSKRGFDEASNKKGKTKEFKKVRPSFPYDPQFSYGLNLSARPPWMLFLSLKTLVRRPSILTTPRSLV